ncbi:MAG: primosomal protein N' [Leptolyngbyaceae cyanobacterium T60_A2020_046]|nr:primosomal protein N' [Leptolyngbyaceae cyanobacterium T60_A2020_046]
MDIPPGQQRKNIAVTTTWVEVLVDCPGAQGLYTYQVPPELTVAAGDILSVPFGKQQVGAIAVRPITTLPSTLTLDQVRPVAAVVNSGLFSSTYWHLLEQVADYYQTPLMQVIRTALPPGLLARSQRRIRLIPDAMPPEALQFLSPSAACVLTALQQSAEGDYTWQHLQRQCRGASRGIHDLIQRGWAESYIALPTPPRPKQRQAVTLVAEPSREDDTLTPRQLEVLHLLQRQGGDLWLQDALQLCRTTSATLRSLAAKGYLMLEAREVLRQPQQPTLTADRPKAVTPHQATAIAAIAALTDSRTVLLHGVTGSGKTEVYLQAIAPLLGQGKSALVLVPEIGLTPQLTDRFRRRFGDRVCVYHSGLSEGERYDAWRQMLTGKPQVAIGTRSAVFAPLSSLGLIILDEEHDSSFKQDQPAPCYHARTVAQWRATLEGCPLILGSATPSLETWAAIHGTAPQSASPGLYLSLPERIHAQPPPPIQIIDMREELRRGNRSILSTALQTALSTLKTDGGQAILFIHRRGHSSFVSCRACGHVMMCPHCDVSLSHHLPHASARPTLRCHYCGYGQAQPDTCPACQSPYLKHFGSGTQRVIQTLEEQFPDLRSLRFDSDTTRTKGAHRALLTRFAQGEADVLVGTQMLTKGLDLPQVTLVGVIAADGLLYMADYRASERAFQVLTQVAGRAGRGHQPGQVILQTYTPEHPVITAVKAQSVTDFIDLELSQREALRYPPSGRLVLVRVTSPDPNAVEQAATDLAETLAPRLSEQWELLGPAPAPILRVARRYRWHILLKGDCAAPLPPLLGLGDRYPNHVSVTVDIDPLHLT